MTLFKNYLQRLIDTNTEADASQKGVSTAIATIYNWGFQSSPKSTFVVLPEGSFFTLSGPSQDTVASHITGPIKIQAPIDSDIVLSFVEFSMWSADLSNTLALSNGTPITVPAGASHYITDSEFNSNSGSGSDLSMINDGIGGSILTSGGGVYSVNLYLEIA